MEPVYVFVFVFSALSIVFTYYAVVVQHLLAWFALKLVKPVCLIPTESDSQ